MTRAWRPKSKFWLYGFGLACAFGTAALLVLPISTPGKVKEPEAKSYSGADHKLRITTPSGSALPVRFAALTANPADENASSALPTLVGVAGTHAWLKSTSTGRVERLQVGDELDGWRVTAIIRRSAILVRHQERQTLELYQSASAQSDTTAVPGAQNSLALPMEPRLNPQAPTTAVQGQ